MSTTRALVVTLLGAASFVLVAACAPGPASPPAISTPPPAATASAAGPGEGSAGPGASSSLGPASSQASGPASSAAGSYAEQSLAWGRQLAECARSHGIPTFPDPVYSPDGADFGQIDKQLLVQAMDACHDIAIRMPPPPEDEQPPAPATLEHMRQWAQCLREHGLAGFPDPTADGRFPVLGTAFEGVNSAALLTAAQNDALNACQQFQDRDEWQFRAS